MNVAILLYNFLAIYLLPLFDLLLWSTSILYLDLKRVLESQKNLNSPVLLQNGKLEKYY